MKENGFTMNGEKDPVKRIEKLRERIKHLEITKAVILDQIYVMKEEIHAIETDQFLNEVESRNKDPRLDLDVI